ncbi:hypothetical protein [Neisseria sp. 74A18]|uniref:hypothetical protein n=1 Tax=Neisseria sp. 74A18 TaxID=1696094 RepID=UPI0006CE996A|nr:hypothetical protein [Neisseria sp. 74A18]
MRTNKPVEGIAYNSNREGFIFALARRESSADLNKDDTFNEYPIRVINDHGYVGLFQYGTPALIDIGYKTRDGQWTGKNGATSLEAFRSSRQIQIAAINLSIDLWCKRLRATGLNEYYGKIVKGIEITESGCIAGCHLVGLGGLASFLNVPGNLKINKSTGKNHKEFDGNGVHISHYIDLFAHYDMESCCKRKIRIGLKDPSGLPIEGKHVTILSSYEGKHTNSQFKIEHKTDADGELPVIVRHPGAKITLEIDGRKSEDITQKADQIQPFNIVASDLKISAPLAEKGKPEAKKQEAVQEKKEEQQQTLVETNKDINFNIAILEGDTKKPISNVKFTLVYKGKPKQHITDSQGITKNIIAEAGQSVQVCVAGEGNLQPVKSFTVTENLKDTTVEVALPVHTFNIVVVDTKGKIVPNAEFSIFYRNKERTRKTDSEGRLKIKALVGFVCGFGNRGNPLTYFRCLQSVSLRKIIVNSTAVQIAKGSAGQTVVTTAVQAAKQTKEAAKPKPPLPAKTEKQQSKPQERKKDEKPQQQDPVKQKNTHTEKNGNPLTVVGEEKHANLKINILFAKNLTEYHRSLVSDKTKQVLIQLATLAEKKQLIITSTIRTPRKQAELMYNPTATYGEIGQKIIKIAERGKAAGENKEVTLKKMEQKILEFEKQGKKVSRHCVSEDLYKRLNVIDLGIKSNGLSSTQSQKLFYKHCEQLINQGLIAKVLYPGNNKGEKAFHLEIYQ